MSDNGTTYQRQKMVKHTVIAAEASSGSCLIQISTQVPTNEFIFISQIRRSGTEIAGFDADYASGTGYITVSNSTSGTLATDDVVFINGTYLV